jgi:hypothetical protein
MPNPLSAYFCRYQRIPATEHAGRGYDYYYGGWRYLENRAGVSRKSIRLSSGKTLMGVFLVG